MTIPEAASLILKSTFYSKEGNIFVLDMGKPIKILDLAKIIKLSVALILVMKIVLI